MAGLKIDLEQLDAKNDEEVDAVRGSIHTGELLVSANGLTAMGQSYGVRPEDISFTNATLLGRGSSGAVRRVRDVTNNTHLALKEIKVTSHAHVQEIKRELETLHDEQMSCPFLVEFLGAFSYEGSVFIATECMDGSLDMLATYPIAVEPLARMTRCILGGLCYLHKQRHLIHRDLKPSNLLYNLDGSIKITDFGVSSFLECTKGNARSFIGTLTYMSPERMKGEAYSYAADIWSLGLVVAELALGHSPYAHVLCRDGNKISTSSAEARFWVLLQHLNGENPVLSLPPACDADIQDFVLQCVNRDPLGRPQCAKLLEHPFITTHATGTDEENQRALGKWLESEISRRRPGAHKGKLGGPVVTKSAACRGKRCDGNGCCGHDGEDVADGHSEHRNGHGHGHRHRKHGEDDGGACCSGGTCRCNASSSSQTATSKPDSSRRTAGKGEAPDGNEDSTGKLQVGDSEDGCCCNGDKSKTVVVGIEEAHRRNFQCGVDEDSTACSLGMYDDIGGAEAQTPEPSLNLDEELNNLFVRHME